LNRISERIPHGLRWGKVEIFNDPVLKVLQINVETFKGVVQLSGYVDSAQASAKAAALANSVEGVKSVKNNLIVK